MLPFKILAELAVNINRNKVKQIDVLTDAGDESKRINRLYNGLLKKKYNSDAEAARDIFDSDENYIQYRKLRLKLFDTLINTSFFVDSNLSKFPEATRAEFNCYRYFAAANMLLQVSAQEPATYLLKRVLEKCIKYELTNLAAEVSWLLRTKIRNISDKKETSRYIQINEKIEQKRTREKEATLVFEELIQFFAGGRGVNKNLYKKIETKYQQLSEMAEEVDTVQFYYLTYSIGTAHFMAGNDCRSALTVCQKAIDFIESRPHVNSNAKLTSFYVNGLACCTQLKIFTPEPAQQLIKRCYDLSPEFGINRIKVLETEIQHYLYAPKYTLALNRFETAKKHPRFSSLKGINAEIWKIYAGYFYLLARLGEMNMTTVLEITGDIDPDLIDYNITVFKKDKEGMNIPILMLPVLVGALEGQIEGHVRTKDALIQYAKRYLKKQKNIRSNAMLDFLLAIETYTYQKKAALKIIQKTLDTFQQVPIELSEQSSAIEIIPYETLVQLICRERNIVL
jgi:hypothetical protein